MLININKNKKISNKFKLTKKFRMPKLLKFKIIKINK